jgi:UTP--glucose-1-phosphate uridylyltransferase
MTNRSVEVQVDAPEPDIRCQPFAAKMRADGLPEAAIASFCLHLARYLDGVQATLPEDAIEPVVDLPDAEALTGAAELGRMALGRVAVIKLNGGLGTGMGLESAKSLLELRDGLSFLDLIARQTLSLREQTGVPVPLLLMNSFHTAADCEAVLDRYPGLAVEGLPLSFLQHRIPKVLVEGAAPAAWPPDPELEWCPPGHGDLYAALAASGVLDRLLERGIELAFVSNADNLGAVLDLAILGHVVERRLAFLLEAADRTPSDRKGGHLCRYRDGRLALREAAQCPPEDAAAFQDIERHRFFNSNNLWLHLPSLRRSLDEHGGIVPLPTIVNRKTLDPRDPSSPAVVQLESAMGAAISLLAPSAALRVSRRRFSPVKTTDDLLAARSDAYRLGADGRLALDESRRRPPVVSLDPRYFAMIDDFERRFPAGPPSLIGCDALTVEGDVSFGRGVVLRGSVRIAAASGAATVGDGAELEGEIRL